MTAAVDIGTDGNRVQNIYAKNIDCETLTTQSSKSLYYKNCFRWKNYWTDTVTGSWKVADFTIPYSDFPFTPETNDEKSYFIDTITISFSVTAANAEYDDVECTRTLPLRTFLECTEKNGNNKGPLAVEASSVEHNKGAAVAADGGYSWTSTGLTFHVNYKTINTSSQPTSAFGYIRVSVKIL